MEVAFAWVNMGMQMMEKYLAKLTPTLLADKQKSKRTRGNTILIKKSWAENPLALSVNKQGGEFSLFFSRTFEDQSGSYKICWQEMS